MAGFWAGGTINGRKVLSEQQLANQYGGEWANYGGTGYQPAQAPGGYMAPLQTPRPGAGVGIGSGGGKGPEVDMAAKKAAYQANSQGGRPWAPVPSGTNVPSQWTYAPAGAPWSVTAAANDKNAANVYATNVGNQMGMKNPQIMSGGAVSGGGLPGLAGGMGGGGIGGIGGGTAGTLANQFQSAMDAANRANEQRYGEAKGEASDLRNRSFDFLQGAGTQEARDINTASEGLRGRINSNAVSRGMAGLNPGVTDALVERERSANLGRLNERLRGQYLDTDANTTGTMLNLIASKEDNAPSYSDLAALYTSMGQGGAGAGGYGGGGIGGAYPMAMTMQPYVAGYYDVPTKNLTQGGVAAPVLNKYGRSQGDLDWLRQLRAAGYDR